MSNNYKIYIFKDGQQFTDLTGGWQQGVVNTNPDDYAAVVASVGNSLFNKSVTLSGGAWATTTTKNSIDIGPYKDMNFKINFFASGSDNNNFKGHFGLTTTVKSTSFTYESTYKKIGSTNTTVTLNLSGKTGSYYPTTGMYTSRATAQMNVYQIWFNTEFDAISIENQTDEEISFNIDTRFDFVSILEARILANGRCIARITENLSSANTHQIDWKKLNYGENEITIEVDYLQDGVTTLETVSCVSDVIITKDVDIADFEKMEELPLNSTFDDLLVRLNEVKNVNNSIRDNLNKILSSKGIYVDESMRLSKLVNLTIELTNENSQEINDYITQIATLENEIDNLTSELAGKVTPAGDAVAENVLSSKTFINSTGQLVTGTMVNRESKTFTPSASKQTAAAGYYSSITCNAVSNLSAGNIKSGVVVGGVTGTCPYYTVTSPGSTTWIAATTISDRSWGYTNGSYINIYTSNAAPATGTYNIYIKVFGAESSDAFRIRLYTSKNRTLATQNGSPNAAISGNYSLSKGEILYYQIDSQNGGYGAHVGFEIQAVTYTLTLY